MPEIARSTAPEATGLKEDEESSPQAKAEPSPPNRDAESLPNPKASRKRTKTGCLTCRKRRIKCGEERPTCKNCIKSKRSCEGYNPRVIFKDPLSAIRTPGNAYQSNSLNLPRLDRSSTSSSSNAGHSRGQPTTAPTNPLPAIAPRPVPQYDPHLSTFSSLAALQSAPVSFPAPTHSRNDSIPAVPENLQAQTSPFFHARAPAEFQQLASHMPSSFLLGRDAIYPAEPSSGDYTELVSQAHPASFSQFVPGVGNSPGIETAVEVAGNLQGASVAEYQPSPSWRTATSHEVEGSGTTQWPSTTEEAWQSGPSQVIGTGSHNAVPSVPLGTPLDQHLKMPHSGDPPIKADSADIGGYFLGYKEEEKYSDIETDDLGEDDVMQTDSEVAVEDQNTGLIRALHATQDEKLMRSFTSFLNEPNILSTYRPSMIATPLLDPKTARIFCHFITATGPSLSIFERHPMNPSVILTGAPVPHAQQSLWTYVLPVMALHHQALLHAMLALASLHISRLQNTSSTPSLKHYHYALRRVGRCVASHSQRLEIATLAATLLLGFYEVMTAEHTKWNSHLSGAKQLIAELNLAEKSKRLRGMKREAAATIKQAQDAYFAGDPTSLSNLHMMGLNPLANAFRPEDDIDEKLISKLMGRQFRYDYYGRVIDGELGGVAGAPKPPLSPQDIENFKTQQDLFWWYCKQDVYQSVLSGNALLLDYDRWADCTPRAPIGRLNAVYGTVDHLVLLLGRIATFACNDLRRKRRVIKANGGVWRPPKKFQAGPTNAAATNQNPLRSQNTAQQNPMDSQGAEDTQSVRKRPLTGPNPSTAPPQGFPSGASSAGPGGPPPMGIKMPSMYGMVPSEGPPDMPSAFTATTLNPRTSSSSSSSSTTLPHGTSTTDTTSSLPNSGASSRPHHISTVDDIELEAATVEAEEEWSQINDAINTFEESLGSEYQPLSPEYMQPTSTPFGPAIYYRTYSMACMWALFYTARIIAARVQPSMPPAAMVAAGIAARDTAQLANLIGRIAAGIRPTPPSQPLNPSLGAALVEISLPLFFGGIQYIDPAQRNWVIARLMDVTRRTGWRSSAAIAAGCEAAWVRAAEAGRGPPYHRRTDPLMDETRVAANRVPQNAAQSDHSARSTGDEAKAGDVHAQLNNLDRRFVTVNSQARLHYALGLLSVEEDIARLDIN
ncbi:hypothetical protein L228DRAFT_75322 [Xylona heveae TC161]|uniref:Zn(2)-C6 fungal-type domain-containing protein n=1 Tax=Xylona heveae (strain CBS 132557 / TC161) TaxID=1328760 RepID=A0A165ITP6_XYLHT|nr:hypothetical protein L228DRAFT_75322 [Xylona heveae TC161]KZF25375.1 hypothetical protein L228DRAFT_75322 [Xylona heveae TC161]